MRKADVMPDAVNKNVKLVDILPKVSDVLVLLDKSSVFLITGSYFSPPSTSSRRASNTLSAFTCTLTAYTTL